MLNKFFRKKKPQVKQEDVFLPTAREAWENTKEPQLKNCINQINSATKSGSTHTYIGDREKLHDETIAYLTGLGYDIKTTLYKAKPGENFLRERDEYFNEVFWHEGTTGTFSLVEK